jgi:Fic family protein
MDRVFTFGIDLDWNLVAAISNIDRFDASWSTIERREGQSLKQLKSIATVRSVGASTRIEGSKMSDTDVDLLLEDLNIDKLHDRDAQEVVGYFEVMDLISESHMHIDISESSIKDLHNRLMRHNQKDHWHRGAYKPHTNSVEATMADGAKKMIFETTPPGFETEDAMRALIDWYKRDQNVHPLVKCALFTYEFVSIHPFQDGNGRLSRLLSTLLLLKNGYKWIEYVSFEHEIENRKSEYYQQLRACQAQRPNENVTSWVHFYFGAIMHIQEELLNKLEMTGFMSTLPPRTKSIMTYISEYPGSKSGDIATRLEIPNPTVKRILSSMVEDGIIEKYGSGPGTNYALK